VIFATIQDKYQDIHLNLATNVSFRVFFIIHYNLIISGHTDFAVITMAVILNKTFWEELMPYFSDTQGSHTNKNRETHGQDGNRQQAARRPVNLPSLFKMSKVG
jgi:hypothetical protein